MPEFHLQPVDTHISLRGYLPILTLEFDNTFYFILLAKEQIAYIHTHCLYMSQH